MALKSRRNKFYGQKYIIETLVKAGRRKNKSLRRRRKRRQLRHLVVTTFENEEQKEEEAATREVFARLWFDESIPAKLDTLYREGRKGLCSAIRSPCRH